MPPVADRSPRTAVEVRTAEGESALVLAGKVGPAAIVPLVVVVVVGRDERFVEGAGGGLLACPPRRAS